MNQNHDYEEDRFLIRRSLTITDIWRDKQRTRLKEILPTEEEAEFDHHYFLV